MSCGFNTLPAMPLNATWASVPIAASHHIPYAQISLPCASPAPCPAPCAFPKHTFSQCAQPLPAFPVSRCTNPIPVLPIAAQAQFPVSQCAQPLPTFPVSRCANPIPVLPVSAPLQIPFQFQTSEYRPVIPRCPTPFSAQIPAYPVNSQFLLPRSVPSCRLPCARRCC
ncbi:hypothetical protein BpHYR1_043165 [Brachionus plicatilis]|uniref:Uncharacterized protein n=1 Tax=Brachionus plicatilis TaxID=10195 RepID=A0A3M7QI47_BRAPC|nr:hypothetical protein BpHYR1_043165 [Brachionus plicatilis]